MPLRITLRARDDTPPTPFTRLMERLALADRRALGLRFGEPCDPRRLMELHDVERILECPEDYCEDLEMCADEIAAVFAGLDGWSSLTFAIRPHEQWILVNPCHSPRRRALSIAHEFGHLVLGHSAVTIDRLDGALAHSRYSDAQEHEAYAYGLAFLIPYAPLLQLLDASASEQAIAELYGVSVDAVQMRLKLVGLWRARTAR
jgi:hypothetical protein